MIRLLRHLPAFALALVLAGCGSSISSDLSPEEKALYDEFVTPDVASASSDQLDELVAACVKLVEADAHRKMSTEEEERATAQITALIQRLESDLAQGRAGSHAGQQIYRLKSFIGRGG